MWTKEPALIVGFVGAAIALGVSFGLPVSAEQVGFIMAFVTAGLAFVTRSQVTPVTKLIAAVFSAAGVFSAVTTSNAANDPGTAGNGTITFPPTPPAAG